MPFAAHALSRSMFADAGVHTNTRSAAPSGMSAMSATVRTPSTSSPWRFVPKTLPAYPDASRLCSDTKPNFPGCVDAPATSTPRGSNSAANCSAVGVRRFGVASASLSGDRSSTRASTATGLPSAVTISGLTSTPATSSRSAITRPMAMSVAARASRSTAASPRNSPSSFAVARSSIISAVVVASSGAGRNTTSAIASARMPPTPSITVGPNCGSRSAPTMSSRLPCTIGATRTVTSPSAGVAAARRSVAAASTSAAVRRLRRTRPRSVLWAIASPLSLATTG